MSTRRKLFAAAGVAVVSIASVGATDWYVKTGGDDSADGKGWGSAFATIQTATGKAKAEDTIWVEDGYVSGVDLSKAGADSMVTVPKGVTLRSVSGDWRSGTTIKGSFPEDAVTNKDQQTSADARRCVYLNDNAALIGFIVEEGIPRSYQTGGGVRATGLSCIISNCLVRNCFACYGGGGIAGGLVSHCVISNNFSWNAGGGVSGCTWGGKSSPSELHRCEVAYNGARSSASTGGAGGVESASVYWCDIHDNFTNASGGGLRQTTGFSGECRNTDIYRNRSTGCAAVDGAGYALYDCGISNNTSKSDGVVGCNCFDCWIVGNSASSKAVGNNVYARCRVFDNVATNCAGGGMTYSGTFTNCVIVGNKMYSSATYAYGCVGYDGSTLVGCVISNNESYVKGARSGSRYGVVSYQGNVIGCILTGNDGSHAIMGKASGRYANNLIYDNRVTTAEVNSGVHYNTTIVNTNGKTTLNSGTLVNSVCWNGTACGDNATTVTNSCSAKASKDPTGTSFSTDPMLDERFMPLQNSPCRDACTNGFAFAWMTDKTDARSKDAYGKARVWGAAADIGGVEFFIPPGMMLLIR